jgi:dolichol-phosphate mannosyltransferase
MISVVVPIFNEEENIVPFHEAVADALVDIGEEWEVVYVNDGSRDSSLDLLRNLQEGDAHVVVVDLSRNWGHMGAISAGLQTARGDAVVLMDGDFQDPPEVIPELVQSWRNGGQVVVAVRRSRQERRKLCQVVSAFLPGAWSALRLSNSAERRHFRLDGSSDRRLHQLHA